MTYRTDIFGYVLLEGSNASNYGVSSENEDNYTELQTAIDAGYRTLVIGDSEDEFVISQPLVLKEGKTYVINAKIKIKDGSEALLTSDLFDDGYTFDVDHPELFAVGDWIGIADDASGVFHGRQYGSEAKITDITDDTVTVDRLRDKDYLVSENAFIGHIQNVIIADTVDNIKIIGSGELNQNKDNQSNIYALNPTAGESKYTSCGISVTNVDNFQIDGLTSVNGLMHNFNFSNDITNLKLKNLTAKDCVDKNILIRGAVDVEVDNILVEDSIYEDGIIFYSGCVNVTARNITAKNNTRNGFTWNGESNDNLVAGNLYLEENETNLRIACKNATLANVVSVDGLVTISDQYVCHDIVINNLTIRDTTGTYMLGFRGGVEDIVINNLIIDGCNGVGIHASEWVEEGELPINVVINGKGIYNHTGAKTEIAEGSEITFNDFEGL